jgi:hypothetical protein
MQNTFSEKAKTDKHVSEIVGTNFGAIIGVCNRKKKETCCDDINFGSHSNKN